MRFSQVPRDLWCINSSIAAHKLGSRDDLTTINLQSCPGGLPFKVYQMAKTCKLQYHMRKNSIWCAIGEHHIRLVLESILLKDSIFVVFQDRMSINHNKDCCCLQKKIIIQNFSDIKSVPTSLGNISYLVHRIIKPTVKKQFNKDEASWVPYNIDSIYFDQDKLFTHKIDIYLFWHVL